MNILGISAFYHDSAACLVRDGDTVAVVDMGSDEYGSAYRDGDLNGDGCVDFYDLPPLAGAYEHSQGEPEYKPEAGMNHEGVVDFWDLPLFSGVYGTCY